MSTVDLIALFHHRWAPPALAELARREGVRFVELQNRLGVGRESLRRALDALLDLGYARRNPGYGHPLRPEYFVTARGRGTGAACARVLAEGDAEVLLRKWSVPTLAALDEARRFADLRAALPGVTPRALALALRDLEAGALVKRQVIPSHPPHAVYSATASGRKLQRALSVRRGPDERGLRDA